MSVTWVELSIYLAVLLLAARPLGQFMARVLSGERTWASAALDPVERLCYRFARVDPAEDMTWRRYALAMMLFNIAGLLAVYGLQRLQHLLPLNPARLGAVTPDSAFNTAVSFATNTNWQGYGGETTMSYLTQALGLTVQNFVSAATGIATLAAFIRGFTRRSSGAIGNFWADLTRSTLYIMLPLSLVLAVVLVSQGVVQNFSAYHSVAMVQGTTDADGKAVLDQVLPMGPAASQIAIKQLGTNGGGFFNVNSAHPFENPTPLTNFVEML